MKSLLALCAVLSVGIATQALADLCADMRALNVQTGAVDMGLPDTDKTTTCKTSRLLSGGAQLHCGWAFDYRAPEATQAFERLVALVGDCLGDAAAVKADLDVNHPDFYDLQTFTLEGQEIGVSLKDKAALSETYVFLRIALPGS